ncbi:nucleophosmin 1b [Stigmatopora argus]
MDDDISDMNRPQMYLFGCTLKSDKREYKVDVDDDETEQQLSLKAACLGAEAEDKFHTVEVEAHTFDGKATKIPLVVLKPSVLPSMGLGGFEITPPVTLRLLSGSGPVYISGQHFVSVKDSDNEEEHNSSPVKRPAGLMFGEKTLLKKLKMDSEEDSDEDEDEEEDDDDDDEEEDEYVIGPEMSKKANKNRMKQNGPAPKTSGLLVKPQNKTPVPGKDKAQTVLPKSPSLDEIKSKLSASAKEGKTMPKTEQKFENFVKSSFKISDKTMVKELWDFVKTLKMEQK